MIETESFEVVGMELTRQEQLRYFAVCAPPQLQHIGGKSRVLVHFAAEWLLLRFTQL